MLFLSLYYVVLWYFHFLFYKNYVVVVHSYLMTFNLCLLIYIYIAALSIYQTDQNNFHATYQTNTNSKQLFLKNISLFIWFKTIHKSLCNIN
jgi:hypothetical protein